MNDEQLRLLVQSMENFVWNEREDGKRVMNMLAEETLKFRDKLKEERGEILTVGDTRISLEALGARLNGMPMPEKMTSEQKALTQIWLDRLTLFSRP
ncbi:hypothetical protein GF377_01720 [candidate division GN15 bacterium]|nr:hypothetical protein [candidate division GN15 bacterium]